MDVQIAVSQVEAAKIGCAAERGSLEAAAWKCFDDQGSLGNGFGIAGISVASAAQVSLVGSWAGGWLVEHLRCRYP